MKQGKKVIIQNNINIADGNWWETLFNSTLKKINVKKKAKNTGFAKSEVETSTSMKSEDKL